MSSGPDARADTADTPGPLRARIGDGGGRTGDLIVAASALREVFAVIRGIRAPLVLIDGPSGAGKSTLADALRSGWPGLRPVLVRLDDVYPGWSGLERAGDVLARTLVPRHRRGTVGSWRRWDWAGDRPGALERVRPGSALIIEGCGAFASGASAADAVRIWIDAPDALRKRRALERDGGAYDPFWNIWERQWRRYVHRTAPERFAALRLRAAPDGRVEPEPMTGAAPVHARARGLT